MNVDPTKLEIKPVPWSPFDRTVRYDGQYVGCVKKIGDANLSMAISVRRKGEQILQECGRAGSLESGAHDVAYQWLLNWEHLREEGDF